MTPKNNKKKSPWVEIDTLMDPASSLGVVISRKKGPSPDYTFALVKVDGERTLRGIRLPIEGEHDAEHVVFSLVKAARERIEEERAKDAKRAEKRAQRKPHGAPEGQKPSGLSQLAKKDAASKGHDYVGKTARKRQSKAG